MATVDVICPARCRKPRWFSHHLYTSRGPHSETRFDAGLGAPPERRVVNQVMTVIDKIRAHGETKLADALQRLIDDFEYDKTLALIQQAEEKP